MHELTEWNCVGNTRSDDDDDDDVLSNESA